MAEPLFLSPEWFEQVGKDVEQGAKDFGTTLRDGPTQVMHDIANGDVMQGIWKVQDDISQGMYNVLYPNNPDANWVVDQIENGPAPELPLVRTVIDAPTRSNAWVDFYDGTDEAEEFNVQTQYLRNTPFKSNIVYAEGGDDIVNGASGKDFLYGGKGKDELKGNGGDDFLNGGKNNDVLTGGSGKDTFIFSEGQDVVTDFSGALDSDKIELGGFQGTVSVKEFTDRNGIIHTAVSKSADNFMAFKNTRGLEVISGLEGNFGLNIVAKNFDATGSLPDLVKSVSQDSAISSDELINMVAADPGLI